MKKTLHQVTLDKQRSLIIAGLQDKSNKEEGFITQQETPEMQPHSQMV